MLKKYTGGGVAAAVIMAVVILGFVFLGGGNSLTLAQVQEAVARESWVHVKYDNGREKWVSLHDGKTYYKRGDGEIIFVDHVNNIRYFYNGPGSKVMNQVLNTVIASLNSVGQAFWNYAATMFVQASILILFLLLADFLLRKRVRAVFRYCLWMLVFIKLVLPTSLVLPTGIGYWLGDYWPSKPAVSAEIPAVDPSMAATVAPAVAAEGGFPASKIVEPVTSTPSVETAPAEIQLEPISWQGLVFLGWIVGMLVFLALLVQRARFVKGLLAQAQEANGKLQDLLNQCRADVGLKKQIVLKISANMVSPAVCGLFRATILLPSYMIEELNTQKLRAILIHELAHIKRWDIWVNLVQTILQIVYFYNPLVWLANAMVRRAREQAVDETVLVALGREAKGYGHILIDIAEMAVWRPTLSLRLIGVVESKKALTQRIKHIISRPLPKTAKLGLLGLAVVIISAAVLVPMAKSGETIAADDEIRPWAEVAGSATDMRNILLVCQVYAHEHDGEWPETLESLVKDGRYAGRIEQRLGRRKSDFWKRYVYIKPGRNYESLDRPVIVMYESLAVSKGGINVAFAEGSIGFVGDTDHLLLQVVRSTRAATLPLISEGKGLAKASFHEMTIMAGRKRKSVVPRHKVEFVFSESDSLYKHYNDEGSITSSVLIKGGSRVRYRVGKGNAPTSVRIQRYDLHMMFAPALRNWCFEDIAKVPVPSTEVEFWDYVTSLPSLRVEREGNIVRMSYTASSGKDIALDESIIEFGMEHGAMVSRWSHRRVMTSYGKELDMAEHGKLSWTKQANAFIPTQRYVELIVDADGKRQQEARSDISFSKFSAEKISPEELTIYRMGIPEGTPVVDQIEGRQWQFSPTTTQPSASRAAETLTFGPVIERWIGDIDGGKSQFLDLNSGRSLDVPEGMKKANWSSDKNRRWMQRRKMDLFLQHTPNRWVLGGVFLQLSLIDNAVWDQPDYRTVREAAYRVQAGVPERRVNGISYYELPTELKPVTFAFRTWDEGFGILQITEFTNNPRGAKIRYKKLRLRGIDAMIAFELSFAPDARQEVESLLAATLTGKDREAGVNIEPGSTVAGQLDDLRKLVGKNKLWIRNVYAEGKDAIALSSEVEDERGQKGQLLFRMRSNQVGFGVSRWQAYDIDLKSLDDIRKRVRDFLNQHPNTLEIFAEGPAAREFFWGQPVEGVQCRLRADQLVWKAGEMPVFKGDVRNQGKRELIVYQAQQLCELEFDGQWYRWSGEIGAKSSWFPPGREYNDITISLGRDWYSKRGNKPLSLKAGKYSIRVAFIASPEGAGKPVRVVSNPVEIEIQPATEAEERPLEVSDDVQTINEALDDFLDATVENDTDKMATVFHPDNQEKAKEVFQQLQKILLEELPKGIDVSPMIIMYDANDARTISKLFEFSNPQITVSAVRIIDLKKHNGQWKISSFVPVDLAVRLPDYYSYWQKKHPAAKYWFDPNTPDWLRPQQNLKINKIVEQLTRIVKSVHKANPGKKELLYQRVAPMFPEIRQILANGSNRERRDILDIVKRYNLSGRLDESFVEPIKSCLKDSDPRVRELSLLSIGDLFGKTGECSDEILDIMEKLSRDSYSKVRSETARFIGSHWIWNVPSQNTKAIDILIRLARDKNNDTRSSAFYHGLSRIIDPNAVKHLIELALSERDKDYYTYKIICIALEKSYATKEILKQYFDDVSHKEAAKKLYKDLFNNSS